MKYLASLCLLAPLYGCVGTVQSYSGEPRAINKVSVVRGVITEFAGSNYHTFFASYAPFVPGKKPEFQNVGDAFVGYPRELHMAPGSYLLLTRCHIGNQYAFPSVHLDAVEGMTHEIICEPVSDELSKVKATFRKSEKTPAQK